MNITETYKDVTNDIEEIFRSYRTLYEVYIAYFKAIDKTGVRNASTAITVLENAKKSVDKSQRKISSKLYSQGLVLLIGSSESILREAFRALVTNNLEKVNIKDNVHFSFVEVKAIIEGRKDVAGELLLNKLEDEKSPAEKLNFQNMKQLQGILKGYFDISLKDSYLTELHKYWQIRHVVIHNSSVADQKFIENLAAANIDTTDYKLGKKVKVYKADYDRCKKALGMLFSDVDSEINRNGLLLND
jgi:hypothetical protein